MSDLILASGSAYRRMLLDRLGLAFEVIAADIDESPRVNESGADLALRLGCAKARAVAEQYPDRLVIGSDQVAECEGRLLGKPGSPERAIEQLGLCSGREIVFHTSVALARDEQLLSRLVPTRVVMRELTRETIERYVARDQPLDCAGAMKSEALGIALARAMSSDDPTALIGLPLIATTTLLGEFGRTIP